MYKSIWAELLDPLWKAQVLSENSMLFPTLVLEWSGMQVFVFAAGSPIGLCQFWPLR